MASGASGIESRHLKIDGGEGKMCVSGAGRRRLCVRVCAGRPAAAMEVPPRNLMVYQYPGNPLFHMIGDVPGWALLMFIPIPTSSSLKSNIHPFGSVFI